ncbi:MAG: Gfo/Idh/MocA family oxidoreductase [Clostridia bacterium]|nr:Gfo/Idh/MocA family oxidoreductase [Clostridia bacterium]
MPLKIGVIGSNFVSDWLCQAVQETGEFTLAAMYSRKQETGEAFAAKYSIPLVYTDMEAFLSSDLDAVYIATPNFCHAPQAINALKHGKHVLCEKPIATSLAEWKEMESAALENDRVLLEAMRPAFDPAIRTVKENLPKLGTIRRAVFEYCQYSSRYDKFKAGEILNAFNPALGNAAIMDIGVYAVHVCAMLFGRPLSVSSQSVMLCNGMEGMGTIFMPYGGETAGEGFQAQVVYAKIIDSVNPSVITGENGSILIDKLSQPGLVTLKLRGQDSQVLFTKETDNNMIYQVRAFAELIRNHDIDHAYKKVSAIEMEILDAVREQNGIVFGEQ